MTFEWASVPAEKVEAIKATAEKAIEIVQEAGDDADVMLCLGVVLGCYVQAAKNPAFALNVVGQVVQGIVDGSLLEEPETKKP